MGRNPHLSSRVLGLERVVSRSTADAVAARRTRGRNVLDLYGAPYWLPPDHVLEAASKAVTDSSSAPAAGSSELRRAISKKLARDNGIIVDPDREVLVTNAAMHALSIVFTALLNPGDEVVMFAPGFFFYGPIRLAGGVPVYVESSQEDGWRWPVTALAESLTARTKMIVLNSPTNPTGHVASRGDLEEIAELASERDLLILSDEAYETMLYDGAAHHSIASIESARDRTISVFSFTKSHALKQWRIGYIAAPSGLSEQFFKVLEWNVLSCNHVAQASARAALEGPQDWVKETATRYQHCRDLMVEKLTDTPGVDFTIPGGAPFLLIDVSALNVSGSEFASCLLEEYGVAVDPGGPFQAPCHVRLAFGGEDEVIVEAASRIRKAAHDFKQRSER
jgi:aspartate aminotransferase